MVFSGELPPELVSIIREYAKPRLRFPNAYKEVLKIFKLKRWPELMEKLSGAEAKKVLAVTKVFLVARKGYLQADKACSRELSPENRATREAFYEMSQPTYDALMIMVYGKKPDYRWSWPYAEDEEQEEL